MSVCSTGVLSDISEFAAWDEAHPLPKGEVHEQSREQSLIDMAQPERVWEGEDSSNDARSELEGEAEVVTAKKTKGKSKLPKVIPSSTQTSLGSGSQESQKSNATVTVKGQSQDLQGRKLDPESDVDVPPSSQPREESGDEDMADEAEGLNSKPAPEPTTVTKVNGAVLEESEDDLLDGFDIAPEEKEFLKELLPQASQEERGLLQRAKENDDYNGTRRLSTFQDEHEFLEYLNTSVQDFAKEHPFWTQKKWEEDDMAEFETDVHEFAVAAGMKDRQADFEVAKAIKLWKSEKAVNVVPTIETAPTVETIPVVEPGSSNRKRKREQKTASIAVPIQLTVAADEDAQSQKKRRKETKKAQKIENRAKNAERIAAGKAIRSEDCEALEESAIKLPQDISKPAPVTEVPTPALATVVSEPAIAKPTKKEKKLAKKLRQQQGMTSKPVVTNAKLNLQSSEEWYGATLQKEKTPSPESRTVEIKSVDVEFAPVLLEDQPVSINSTIAEASEANSTKKRSRKKSKQGPVASAYFPKAADSVKSGSKEPSAEAESTEPTTEAEIPADLAAKIAAAKAAVKKVVAAQEKEKRRPKKRNHNKLPEEKNVESTTAEVQMEESTPVAPTTVAPSGGAPSLRRQRKRKDRKSKAHDGALVVEKVAVAFEETTLPVNPVPKPEESSVTISEPVTAAQVKPDKPVSKKRSRNQDEASGPKEITTTDVAAEPEEPRQKRSRNRKSRAQVQKEKEQNLATPAAKPSSKLVQQEDVPMSNTTEALTELVDTNSKKKTRRDRGRKSVNKMDVDPQSAESKARHL